MNQLKITKIILLFSIGSFNNYHLFVRLPVLLTYCGLIFIIVNFSNKENNTKLMSSIVAKKQYNYRTLFVKVTLYAVCIVNVIYYFFSYQYRIICF